MVKVRLSRTRYVPVQIYGTANAGLMARAPQELSESLLEFLVNLKVVKCTGQTLTDGRVLNSTKF
jgi:hypothetical protein